MTQAITRILLAVDSATPQRGALEAVAALGIAERIQLSAIFFEDQDLLQSATLSCAREIAAGGLPPALLNRSLIEQQLRAQAARLQRHLADQAAVLGAKCEFHSARGPLQVELLRHAREHDVLVLGRPAAIASLPAWMGTRMERLLTSGPPTIVLVQERWSKGSGILALAGESADAARSLSTARRIATAASLPLEVVRRQGGAGGADQLGLDDIALLRLIRRRDVRGVVLPLSLAQAAPELIPAIMRRCGCSVVVCA